MVLTHEYWGWACSQIYTWFLDYNNKYIYICIYQVCRLFSDCSQHLKIIPCIFWPHMNFPVLPRQVENAIKTAPWAKVGALRGVVWDFWPIFRQQLEFHHGSLIIKRGHSTINNWIWTIKHSVFISRCSKPRRNEKITGPSVADDGFGVTPKKGAE